MRPELYRRIRKARYSHGVGDLSVRPDLYRRFRPTLMVSAGRQYRSHEDGLHQNDAAGAVSQVDTIATDEVAFLHTSPRFANCLMRSLPSKVGRKDHRSIGEISEIVSAANFDAASFVGKELASVAPPTGGQECS